MNFEVILEDLNKVNINKSQINNEANQYDEIFHFLKYSYKYKAHVNGKYFSLNFGK